MSPDRPVERVCPLLRRCGEAELGGPSGFPEVLDPGAVLLPERFRGPVAPSASGPDRTRSLPRRMHGTQPPCRSAAGRATETGWEAAFGRISMAGQRKGPAGGGPF